MLQADRLPGIDLETSSLFLASPFKSRSVKLLQSDFSKTF